MLLLLYGQGCLQQINKGTEYDKVSFIFGGLYVIRIIYRGHPAQYACV
jgi:hypothetical protein